ncbi:hypothetical protein [Pseudoduganella namucuonensis]|uniref:Uncharacterized protein n=1 Tax=Pseudoduganella namucuonensis TaxID=1035707 RepID=A0A1I7LSY5_9BURK|nr:hypothetical protein [Pseudoduganella namucuonensis]SFV12804.1 hypothetical protein SAMN05216552_10373 [Pseudoduganella namucuonensis]
MDEWGDLFSAAGWEPDTHGGIYADNSQGAAPMTTYTPTGGGSGEYVSPALSNWFAGTIDKAMNYAMVRDQQKMSGVATAPIRAVQTQAAQARATDSRLLFWLLIGAGVFYVVKSK